MKKIIAAGALGVVLALGGGSALAQESASDMQAFLSTDDIMLEGASLQEQDDPVESTAPDSESAGNPDGAAATVQAQGVTDSGGDSQIIRKTTTNYFTTVKASATATDSATGLMRTFSLGPSEELSGNTTDSNVNEVIGNYESQLTTWANGLGAVGRSAITGGITDYYYDGHDEITQEVGSGDVILVGDVDDINSAYTANGQITINTILNKHQTYEIKGEFTYQSSLGVLPAYSDKQMVTVGNGDFEEPHYVVLGDDESTVPVTGNVTGYTVGSQPFSDYASLKSYLAGQKAGSVITCSFNYQGTGDYASFGGTGTLTFTMVAAVDAIALTMDAPEAGAALADDVSTAGTAGGTAISSDYLPVQSIAWTPGDDKAMLGTAYTVTVIVKTDQGVQLADKVSATVNGATATCSVSGDTATITYTFPQTPAVAYQAVEGNSSSYVVGSGASLQFVFKRTVNDAKTFSHFTGITVDGVRVDASNYDARSGSAIVTLPAAYLATLSTGDHTLAALFDDGGAATATFTVNEQASAASDANGSAQKSDRVVPRAGDSPMALVMTAMIAVLSAALMAISARHLRRSATSGGRHVRR